MLLEFFLERSRVEPSAGGSPYRGYVPDLPEIYVEAATAEECRAKLAESISGLLSLAAGRRASDVALQADDGGQQSSIDERSGGAEKNGAREIASSEERSEDGDFKFTEIIYEKSDWVACVTINRPEVYNTYTSTTLKEMAAAFRDAARDDRVAVLVLTGAGDRAFCAGSDVKQHNEEHLDHPDRFREWMQSLIEAHEALRQLGKPSIARINGIVAGGGNEWNLACDLAIAADHAKFVHIEAKVGIVAASGATQWLPMVVGERRARELLLTGEPISANKALLWGLVNDVVPFKELDGAVNALCQKLIEKFPECLKYTRQQLGFWKDFAWESTIQQARDWLADHFSSEEAREGMQALLERREIDYRNFRARAASSDAKPTLRPGKPPQASQIKQEGHSIEERIPASEAQTQAGRFCFSCGAHGLPSSFEYCGRCGARLD